MIKALGFHRSPIHEWLARYREGGLRTLRTRKASGCEPKLKGPQFKKLYQIITTKNPLQLQFEFALWTWAMMRELIRAEFKVRLSDFSVGRLLHKLGLSPQKRLRKAWQRDEVKVKA